MANTHLIGLEDKETACGLPARGLPWSERTQFRNNVLCKDCKRAMEYYPSTSQRHDYYPSSPRETKPMAQNYPQAGYSNPPPGSNNAGTSIAERVRFWQEQDQINQTLIPRVIRQHELLTGHIEEHENLPQMVARAVAAATGKALAEQKTQYEAALATQQEQYQAALSAQQEESEAARTQQEQSYETKLAQAITQAKKDLEQRAQRMKLILTGLTATAAAGGLGGLVYSLINA